MMSTFQILKALQRQLAGKSPAWQGLATMPIAPVRSLVSGDVWLKCAFDIESMSRVLGAHASDLRRQLSWKTLASNKGLRWTRKWGADAACRQICRRGT